MDKQNRKYTGVMATSQILKDFGRSQYRLYITKDVAEALLKDQVTVDLDMVLIRGDEPLPTAEEILKKLTKLREVRELLTKLKGMECDLNGDMK